MKDIGIAKPRGLNASVAKPRRKEFPKLVSVSGKGSLVSGNSGSLGISSLPAAPQISSQTKDESLREKTQDAFLELLMCPPKFLSADVSNNIWMKKLDGKEKAVNIDKAMSQFFDMFGLFAQDAFVYLLPAKQGLQDEVYVTNAGVVLPHLERKTCVLANFAAPGRPGEEDQLDMFLRIMDGFDTVDCPYKFEGEADLKWLHDNIYAGGYGIRSDIKSFDWMEKKFGCQIVKVRMTDQLRYHFDCNLFPLSREKTIVAVDMIDSKERKELEKVTEIIPVNKKDAQWSITNGLRIGSILYAGTDISELKKNEEGYEEEKHKNETIEKIARDNGLSLVLINLSEFAKSGAALSCCILHLSYIAYPG